MYVLNSSSKNKDILIKFKFKQLLHFNEYSLCVHFALYLNVQSVEIAMISAFL